MLINRCMKEPGCLTSLCQQQIVQVSVSYSQYVCDDTVSSWEEEETWIRPLRLVSVFCMCQQTNQISTTTQSVSPQLLT